MFIRFLTSFQDEMIRLIKGLARRIVGTKQNSECEKQSQVQQRNQSYKELGTRGNEWRNEGGIDRA